MATETHSDHRTGYNITIFSEAVTCFENQKHETFAVAKHFYAVSFVPY